MTDVRAAVAELVDRLPLLDHHCHGILLHEVSAEQLERLIDEGGNPAPPGTSHWDTPAGLALRRLCAPILDLEPFASAEAYHERRRALGAAEVNRRLLRAAGVTGLIVDTGFRADVIASPAALSELAGAPAWVVVRLETVAEDVARSGVAAAAYPAAFAEALAARAAGAVGLKTIVAYRGGFAFDPSPPSDREVVAAAGRWLRAIEGGAVRLTDPTLLRFGIWTGAALCRDRRLPLQVHAGYGDADLTLHLANPSLLTELLRRLGTLGVQVVLLHCYPYHREAAYLANVLPNVSFDLGLALTFAGASAPRIVAEAMEVAPFARHLYSSDGFGLAELHYLGARHFRTGLARVLGGWVEGGACTLGEAERIAALIGSENARRIYPLA